MKTKKIYPVFAGILYLISCIFLSAFLMEDILYYFNWYIYELGFGDGIFQFICSPEFGKTIGIILSFFLAVVLISKKRGALLSVSIILQLFLLTFFSFPFIGAILLIAYTFLLSLIFRKNSGKEKLKTFSMIIWFVFYAIYLVSVFMFIDEELYRHFISGLLFIVFYSIAWIFILLWILFPCKKEKTAESKTKANTNQQSSKPFPSSVQTANQNLHIQQPNGSFNNNQKTSQSDYSSAGQHKQYSKEQELNILTKQLDCLVHQKGQHQQSSQHTGQYSNSQQAGFSSQQNYQQSNYFDTQKPLQQNGKNQKPQQNTAKQKTVRQCPVCFSTVSEDALYCEICRSKLK